MGRTSLENLQEHGFSDTEIQSYFEISPQTMKKYDKGEVDPDPSKTSRVSSPSVKIEMLDFATAEMKKFFPAHSIVAAEVHVVQIEGEPLIEYINHHANPKDKQWVMTIIRQGIQLKAKDMPFENALDVFRRKYKYINEDTVNEAAKDSPDLVLGVLGMESANVYTRSMALLALAGTCDEQYISIFKYFAGSNSPFIRESAFMGLFNYYDKFEGRNLDLKDYFQQKLESERSSGVRARLKEILGMMA